MDSVIPLARKSELKVDPVRLLSSVQANVLRAFDAQTEGKAPHAYV
jgi:hypothetical protein